MLTEDEIVSTLEPLNGIHFQIDDVRRYAHKLLSCGKAVCTRVDGNLASYVLYYDDGPEAFISMVWTNPRMLRRGHAAALLEGLISRIAKPIALEVDTENLPARRLYAKLGFQNASTDNIREQWRLKRRIAVMQPYFYPWIGYLQLIEAADFFVFYDDVNFIKRGRINRNNILVNGMAHSFTVPISDASQNKLILETVLHEFDRWRNQFVKQLVYSYRKAPFFKEALGIVEGALDSRPNSIADLAIASIRSVYTYLGKELNYARSSEFSPESRDLERAMRLIEITKKADGLRYINMPGGRKLYNKTYFCNFGICLSFLEPKITEYRQYMGQFVPGLSIIDLMMFNTPDQIREMIGHYEVT